MKRSCYVVFVVTIRLNGFMRYRDLERQCPATDKNTRRYATQ